LKEGYKLLALPDIHVTTIPTRRGWEDGTADALWAALEFGKDFKPDETIIMGDFIEFDIISSYTENNYILREGRRLKHDFELANQILDVIDGFTKEKKVFLIGNHDSRLAAWIASNPQIEGLIGLDYNLHLEKRGYKVVEEGKAYRVGHANFIHGWYWNKYHAAKTVTEMGDNIFYGHVHDVQAYTKANYEQKPIVGQSLGCLCDLNPSYRRNKPNRWVNAFGVFFFDSKGYFTYYVPIIINGKFTWCGKTYSGKRK